jgi:sulfite exporter TauE/SafE
MKIVGYIVAVVGVIALALGIYWDVIKHDHPTRGLVALIVGIVLIIAGLVAAFVLKPKAPAAA